MMMSSSCSILLLLLLAATSSNCVSANFLRSAVHYAEEHLSVHSQDQNRVRNLENARDLEERIIGGSRVTGSAPLWFVNWHNGCGGSVIGRDKILTAAHCWSSDLSNYKISIGSLSLDDGSAPFVTHAVDAKIHPQNDPSRGELYDFMVLRLADPIPANLYEPIALNNAASIPATGDSLTVMGFGWTSDTGSGGMSQNLRLVDVNYIPDCTASQYVYSSYPFLYPSSTGAHLCAGVPAGGKDSCAGDSGGPIYKTINSLPVQVGIVSWGDGCARADAPGVYARISTGYAWIQQTRCDDTWTSNASLLHASCNPVAVTPSPTAAPTALHTSYNTLVHTTAPPATAAAPPTTAAPTPAPRVALRVDIHTDNFPIETSWALSHKADQNSDPTLLAQVVAGSYVMPDQDYSSRVYDLPTNGMFILTVVDQDGICCSHGTGSVAVYQIPNTPAPQGQPINLQQENAAKQVILEWKNDEWTVLKQGTFALQPLST